MYTRLCRCLLLSLVAFGSATALLNPLILSDAPFNANDSNTGIWNHILGLPEPPESFSVTSEIGGPKLHRTACLMNAIDALKILALGDWQARISDGTEYKLSSFPDVSISISTLKRKRSIQAKYIIYTIMLGMSQIIAQNKFEFAQFELKWDGTVMGWVHLVNNPQTPRLALSGGGNQSVDMGKRAVDQRVSIGNGNNTSEGININSTSVTNEYVDPAEARLDTEFVPYGKKLGIYDVFLPIMNAFTDMAEYPNDKLAEGLVAGYGDYDGALCILPILPLRTKPPYLDYQFLIRTIARIPGYMLEQGRFGEINIMVRLDGVRVAFGKVSTVPEGCRPTV